jgi:small-conductance mechanosensitive channel
MVDWTGITILALQQAWQSIIEFLPLLIGAIIIFALGWIIAIWIGKLVAGILSKLRFDKLFEGAGWREAFEKAEIKVTPSDFIGAIVKWILIVVFLIVAADILGWTAFATLLAKLLSWVPNLVVSIAIFVVAVVVADILGKMVKASVKKMGVSLTNFVGSAVKWAIYIFAIFAILLQLGVASTIVNTLVVGFVATLAIAFGLAFGLGGKEAAARLIDEARNKLSDK